MKEKMRDPICGTALNPKKVDFNYKFGEQTFYFCTLDCLIIFDDKREEFVSQVVETRLSAWED